MRPTVTAAGHVTPTGAFESFYRRERAGLYRALALALGDQDLAGEAVDEAMTRACQRWSKVRRYDNPAGWVYRVALNWAISRLRRRRRVVEMPQAHPPAESPRGGAGDATAEAALPDERLAAALEALPDAQRVALVLRYHLDWSIDQIATALDAPSGTIKSRLHRGLGTLRARLEGQP